MKIKDIQKFVQNKKPVFTGFDGDESHHNTFEYFQELEKKFNELKTSIHGELQKELVGKDFRDAGLEMTDVVLAIFSLAQRMDIDLEERLEEKITTIEKRFN